MDLSSMPFDLKEEISSMLLPEDATRLKVVCMEWNSMISSSEFTNVHLRKMRMQNNFSPIVQDQLSFPPVVYRRRGVNLLSYYRLITEDDGPSEIVADCRSLICVATINDRMFIVNPVSTECKEIPHALIEWDTTADWASAFFYMGYDAAKDDYVLLRIVVFNNCLRSTQVSVYSTRMNVWRRLSGFPFDGSVSKFSSFVRGKIHFKVSKMGVLARQIGTYNVQDDSWGVIEPPIDQRPRWGERIMWGLWDMNALDDDTIVIYPVRHMNYEDRDFQFLLLQGYGCNEAWSTFTIRFNPQEFMPYSFKPEPLYLVKPGNRKIMFRRAPVGTLFSYDLMSGVMQEEAVGNGLEHFGYCRIINVIPSMVCPGNF